MNATRFLLMGPAESGKTSFLAAFWIYANGAAQAGLSVKCHPQDSSYLDELQQAWLNFKKVPHTSLGMERSVELKIIWKANQEEFNLTIPDLSGESFDEIWVYRHWTPLFQTLLDGSGGALLFMHPEKIEDGVTLQDVQELQAQIQHAEPPGQPEAPAAEKPKPTLFDIAKVPTQIKLIDSLQLIAETGKLNQPFRLGVVVSAWDSVLATQAAAMPGSWLKSRMPALVSYLANNPELFDFKIFGVSAQGVDYGKLTPEFENTPPHARCRVAADGIANSTDVTTPVQWLIRKE
jgi:hypothetical protein